MEHDMIKATDLTTEKTLMPGDPGTKKWMQQYGDKLICIRYRYDRERKTKLKTVELIAEEKSCTNRKPRPSWNRIVKLRIRYGEIHLSRMVKESGGIWNRDEKVWTIPYGTVKNLGLTHRIVK
jgi:hypothetical protein